MMFTDILEEIVAEVANELQPKLNGVDSDIQNIRYEHGKYLEIENRLKDLAGSSEYQKVYPLVALIEDVTSNISEGLQRITNATILICYSTEKFISSDERYKKNIKPILMPIYRAIIDKLNNNENIMDYRVSHRVVERPMLASGYQMIFSRPLDCLEISNLNLTLYPENNC